MKNFTKQLAYLLTCVCLLKTMLPLSAQTHSVAREWNEALLTAIRNDFARPTVHARNLFHVSIAMYDAWAAYEDSADTYFLGKKIDGFTCPFDSIPEPEDKRAAQGEAISYAAFRIMQHRFRPSPGYGRTFVKMLTLMDDRGFPFENTDTAYTSGSPAALGNYIATKLIEFGMQDGANEAKDYRNRHYQPVNSPLVMVQTGNPTISDYNRWQSLTLDEFIDQSGNLRPFDTPDFLSPEWGQVVPFALSEEDLTMYEREDGEYWVYHDPGPPPFLEMGVSGGSSEQYKWGFALVAAWAAYLDPHDGVMWDISPASIGNVQDYPTTIAGLQDFYDLENGGDPGQGYDINPYTGEPYEPQIVPRGDYARVVAEFWADGPDSETPPGHWFTILNYVNDHPLLKKRFKGEGPILDDLEWDVKAYLALGGAMHDAAITAWGIKGWYDYIRPVSAIRAMADRGQSSDPNLLNYDVDGIPLIPGLIELVLEGDSLAGIGDRNVGKIKLYTWRGPGYIEDPETDYAGVGWILAENWWPYQRPSFVTPPFAGYVSGHSTFSRAAAEVLTLLTGDPYFPGGLSKFEAPRNEFLVFEEGPSVDIILQWATYRDASDQCSLSRIWGGIHPPADDVPGRLAGIDVGIDAFRKAETYFTRSATVSNRVELQNLSLLSLYPNPVASDQSMILELQLEQPTQVQATWVDLQGQTAGQKNFPAAAGRHSYELPVAPLLRGLYLLRVQGNDWEDTRRVWVK